MAVVWKKLAYEVDVIKLSVMTEIGDIIYCSSLGPPVVASPLAHGDAGDVLTSAGSGAGPVWDPPAAPAAHKLNSHSVPDGAVDFDLQQATDLILMTVTNVAALPVVGMALGQICFATGELTAHICTAIV
jgi:hypothetical protein